MTDIELRELLIQTAKISSENVSAIADLRVSIKETQDLANSNTTAIADLRASIKETQDIANSNARAIKAISNDVSIIKKTTQMRMEFFESDHSDLQLESHLQNEKIERILVILEKTIDIALSNKTEINKLKSQE